MSFFSDNFTPSANLIINITQGNPGTVTTFTPHGYSSGLVVRLIVPKNCGMTQLDQQLCSVTYVNPTSFTIDIDTSSFDAFGYSSLVAFSQVIPVGEPANTLLQAEVNAKNIVPEF